MTSKIKIGDRLLHLTQIPSGSVDLIYVKPDISSQASASKQNHSHKSVQLAPPPDVDEYVAALMPSVIDAYRTLSPHGTMYFHVGYQYVHYCKARLLDYVFGRNNFINEIIWWTDGITAESQRKWQTRHDYILVYVKDATSYTFNVDDIERIPYMAPSLVGPEKEALGKLPTDTWLTLEDIEDVITRIVRASSSSGDMVLDFYAGNGITGDVCLSLGRRFTLIDSRAEEMQDFITRAQGKPEIEITLSEP